MMRYPLKTSLSLTAEVVIEPIYKVGQAFYELSDVDKRIIIQEQHRQDRLNGGGVLR